MAIDVPAVAFTEVTGASNGDSSQRVRERVAIAYRRQMERQGKANARLVPGDVERHCRPSATAETLLAQAMSRFALSARGYHRVVKVARTIADLDGASDLEATHVAEAIAYRRDLGAF